MITARCSPLAPYLRTSSLRRRHSSCCCSIDYYFSLHCPGSQIPPFWSERAARQEEVLSCHRISCSWWPLPMAPHTDSPRTDMREGCPLCHPRSCAVRNSLLNVCPPAQLDASFSSRPHRRLIAPFAASIAAELSWNSLCCDDVRLAKRLDPWNSTPHCCYDVSIIQQHRSAGLRFFTAPMTDAAMRVFEAGFVRGSDAGALQVRLRYLWVRASRPPWCRNWGLWKWLHHLLIAIYCVCLTHSHSRFFAVFLRSCAARQFMVLKCQKLHFAFLVSRHQAFFSTSEGLWNWCNSMGSKVRAWPARPR